MAWVEHFFWVFLPLGPKRNANDLANFPEVSFPDPILWFYFWPKCARKRYIISTNLIPGRVSCASIFFRFEARFIHQYREIRNKLCGLRFIFVSGETLLERLSRCSWISLRIRFYDLSLGEFHLTEEKLKNTLSLGPHFLGPSFYIHSIVKKVLFLPTLKCEFFVLKLHFNWVFLFFAACTWQALSRMRD